MMGKSIGPGSGVTGSTRWASEVGDPSLRLKSGFAQDDTFEKNQAALLYLHPGGQDSERPPSKCT
jgi:hypothetical protein